MKRALLLALVATSAHAQVGGREYVVAKSPAPLTFPIALSDYKMLTSFFGWRVSPFLKSTLAYHTGLDIAAVKHAQIVVAADGVVRELWPPPGKWWFDGRVYRGHELFGGFVVIDHGNGWSTAYAHLSEVFLHANADGSPMRVKRGQPLGRMGATGQAIKEHLHFEVWFNGEALNPLVYLAKLEGNE